ncbi:MAG TPA: SUMF1/EgtB/PvdO family nonheme iron enzyme [Blastocatellia bacterium]|nr:SUMF1/EgtB/PvdO family nonheme iron enzyme [Blastocatellia bacterium]
MREAHTGEERPTVECRWCHATADATLERCDVCGAALKTDAPIPEGATLCPHCGDVAEQGTVYCKACGRPVARPLESVGGIAGQPGPSASGPVVDVPHSVAPDSEAVDSVKIKPGFFAAQRAESNKSGANESATSGQGLETNAMNAVTELQPGRRTPTGDLSGSRATGIMDAPQFDPPPLSFEPPQLSFEPPQLSFEPTPLSQNAPQGQPVAGDHRVVVDGVEGVARQETQTETGDSMITLIIEPPPASSLGHSAKGLEPEPEWTNFQFSDSSASNQGTMPVQQSAGWNEPFLQPNEQPFVTGYETVAMEAQTEPIADHTQRAEPPPTGEFVAPNIPSHLANPELEKWDSKVRSFSETHPEPAPPPPVVPVVHQAPVYSPHQPYDHRPRADRGASPPPQMMMHAPATSRRGGMGLIVLAVVVVVLLVGALLVWRFALSDAISKRGERTTVTEGETPTEQPAPPINPPSTTAAAAPEGMVYVEGGIYYVGRKDGDLYAQPQHTVTLAPFYIDRTEVTNAEYKRFVDERLHPVPEGWVDGHFPPGMENAPVINVSWQDAADFARWAGKRLPTETEWEAAARGKGDERIYPWGNEWRDLAANMGTQGIVDVGRYKAGASPCGALDMIGNVWEWTSDEFHLYAGNDNPMPTLKPGVTYRVSRGGAYDSQQKVDASYRGFLDADKGYPKVGFRCVKNADQ